METFWFFRLRFRRAYDSAYESDFRFSLGLKLSYDSDYDSDSDSVASENQPLVYRQEWFTGKYTAHEIHTNFPYPHYYERVAVSEDIVPVLCTAEDREW